MKRELRLAVRSRLEALSAAERCGRSAAACGRLVAQPEFATARVVMIYLAMASEADTAAIALAAWSAGKRVAAPRVSWDSRRMVAIELESLSENVGVNPHGFGEPLAGRPVPIEHIDLIIVPGLAFDAAGNRLGRGRGFYDRFLSHEARRAATCGLAFEFQVVEAVPVEAQDVRMDMLVTDEHVRRFAASHQR